MPQLRMDGMEKSGSKTPAVRPVCIGASHRSLRRSDRLKHARRARAELPRLDQQAHDEVPVTIEIEKIARVHEHARIAYQRERACLVGHDRRRLHHGRPAALGRQHAKRGMFRREAAEHLVVQQDTIRDLLPDRRPELQQSCGGHLDGRRRPTGTCPQ